MLWWLLFVVGHGVGVVVVGGGGVDDVFYLFIMISGCYQPVAVCNELAEEPEIETKSRTKPWCCSCSCSLSCKSKPQPKPLFAFRLGLVWLL